MNKDAVIRLVNEQMRIFPLYSPHIESIEVNKQGVVRRARIYYLRNLTGKKARIKEKRAASTK